MEEGKGGIDRGRKGMSESGRTLQSCFLFLLWTQSASCFQFSFAPIRAPTCSKGIAPFRAAYVLRSAGGRVRGGRATTLQCKAAAEEEKTVIVGGGISGLACAVELQERGIPFMVRIVGMLEEPFDPPKVLEESDEVGGRIRTDKVDGFLLDRG
eukprot:767357-Hanusia_phi.AAC.7